MHPSSHETALDSLGALRLSGRDALTFLQGQLSADVTRLGAGTALLAGYHNPQGRVLALLRLIEPAPGEILAVLPRELAAPVRARLAAFILRSKVTLADDSPAWRFTGLVGGAAAAAAASLPGTPGAVVRRDDALIVCVGAPRWLIATPAASPGPEASLVLAGCERATPERWRRLALVAGEPQIYAATSGEFVAQMLNLDALGAIDFDKGCYTGQEVIARAHYRGRVKRRLQRWRSVQPLALAPGDTGELTDGRAFRVVDAVRTEDQGCEFLAVASLAGVRGEAAPDAPPAGERTSARVEAQQLPLPYALPE